MDDTVTITPSCGNVFADLGLPNPEERQFKADIGIQIRKLIAAQGLSEETAASVMGITAAEFTALRCGRLAEFTVFRLFHYLNCLGQRIEVHIYSSEAAETTLIAA